MEVKMKNCIRGRTSPSQGKKTTHAEGTIDIKAMTTLEYGSGMRITESHIPGSDSSTFLRIG
jgi:hypothetical protein